MQYNDKLEKYSSLLINGATYSISNDFRLYITFCDLISSDEQDVDEIIKFIEINKLPFLRETLIALSDLYLPKSTDKKQKKSNWVIKYNILFDLIYSAFLERYRIDLMNVEFLHYIKFKALLNSLNGTTYNEILQCWQKNLKGMKKDERSYYENVRAQFPLGIKIEAKSVEARDKTMREYVLRRFKEVENGEQFSNKN